MALASRNHNIARRRCRGRGLHSECYNWGMKEHTAQDDLRFEPVKDTDPIYTLARRVFETEIDSVPVID